MNRSVILSSKMIKINVLFSSSPRLDLASHRFMQQQTDQIEMEKKRINLLLLLLLFSGATIFNGQRLDRGL